MAEDGSSKGSCQQYSLCQSVRMARRTARKATATIAADGTSRTYEQFEERVARAGTGLRRDLGLGDKCPVAILSLNSDKYLEYFFFTAWAGAWVVPLNIRLAPPEIIAVLNDCAAQAVCFDDVFAPMVPALQKAVPSLRHLIYLGDADAAPHDAVHYEDELANRAEREDAANVGGDDVYGIFYTGGTTGKSKGVMLTHTNVMSNAYCILHALQYDTTSRYLHCAPMFHAADGASTFAVTMVGGTHVFIPKFTPDDTLSAIETHKITHTLMVPTMIAMVISSDKIARTDLSSVRRVLYGASPISEAVLSSAMKSFQCDFLQGYGMTELSPVVSVLMPEDHRKGGELLKSAGRPVPHAEVRIVDENDKDVPTGEVGELIVRGPHVMKGYFNMPEQTAHALKGGWMHTGDGASMDEDGYIYIRDRIKDMIVSGGENVYSVEVENCVAKVPGVAMCAVIGIPDDALVEKVAAVIVPTEPGAVTAEAVIAHCKANIAGYKCPREVIIREEPLPLSGAGKILKTELRRPFWEGKSEIYGTDDNRETEYQ